MRIDPEAEAVLREIERAAKGRPDPRNSAEKLAQARSDTASLARFSAPPPASVRIEETEAPGRSGQAIPLRLYRPANGEKLLLWFHGGGAIAGSLDTHEAPLMALAERTGRVIVSVGYRLAPETRYPGQHEDCLDAARFLVSGALGLPAAGWAIGGDSIGGLYAASTARALRREGASLLPEAQVLLYPNTDLRDTRAWPSLRENEGRIMTRDSLRYEADQSVPRHADRLTPVASPLLADDLAGLPCSFLAACEADPLRDEGEAFGRRLDACGVPLTHRRYDGMIHAFLQMNGRIKRADRLMDDIAAFLRGERG
ncbi:alpha/beta hydrolase [Aureimonas sp. AU40]|uniref:alpha/beta hydrolase n=1 Tax=Aureimonas sp. AU40 TaxID=1637747 RepID=UPI0007849D71|nr:alpha/beta hydrolase [Aureimonas sp. AU40]